MTILIDNIDLRESRYTSIPGRDDIRLVTHAGVELVVDNLTGYFCARHTAKKLDPKKLSCIRREFVCSDIIKQYTDILVCRDIPTNQNNSGNICYEFKPPTIADDQYRGYYFNSDLFIKFVGWLDQTKEEQYTRLINMICQTSNLKEEDHDTMVERLQREHARQLQKMKDELNGIISEKDDSIKKLMDKVDNQTKQNKEIIAQNVSQTNKIDEQTNKIDELLSQNNELLTINKDQTKKLIHIDTNVDSIRREILGVRVQSDNLVGHVTSNIVNKYVIRLAIKNNNEEVVKIISFCGDIKNIPVLKPTYKQIYIKKDVSCSIDNFNAISTRLVTKLGVKNTLKGRKWIMNIYDIDKMLAIFDTMLEYINNPVIDISDKLDTIANKLEAIQDHQQVVNNYVTNEIVNNYNMVQIGDELIDISKTEFYILKHYRQLTLDEQSNLYKVFVKSTNKTYTFTPEDLSHNKRRSM